MWISADEALPELKPEGFLNPEGDEDFFYKSHKLLVSWINEETNLPDYDIACCYKFRNDVKEEWYISWSNEYDDILDDVQYWMPLPELPNG